MTKRQFSLLLGLVGQAGCVIYDDAIRREDSDAGSDVRRDVDIAPRDVVGESAWSDATAVDAEASRDADVDGGAPHDVVQDVGASSDAPDATNVADAGDARDTGAPPPDAPSPDTPPSDVFVDSAVDTTIGVDVREGGSDAPFDAQSDPPIVGCNVDFTVSGVTWDEDVATEDGGARGVRLVGDIGSLGAWAPDAGRVMSEKAPGAWSTSLALADKVTIEFKFVKVRSNNPPEWEQWLPFDSNRSFLVDCGADGGTVWIDAATEAGPASRAVGRSYGGAFGVRPLDATK